MDTSTESIAERLTATASERKYRIRRGAHSKLFMERQNKFDGTWKLDSRESSTNWYVALDMIRRGWAVLVSNEE